MSENKKTAREAASSYLSRRMRTVYEVRKYLENREYKEREISEALKELMSLGYLNDYEYALRYYEYNREKRRGCQRAAAVLAEKGVDGDIIENAKADFLYENEVDEYKDALEIALREADGRDWDDKLEGRIARKLDAKGYSGGDILNVLNEIRKGIKDAE